MTRQAVYRDYPEVRLLRWIHCSVSNDVHHQLRTEMSGDSFGSGLAGQWIKRGAIDTVPTPT